jgi:hypothetical protein
MPNFSSIGAVEVVEKSIARFDHDRPTDRVSQIKACKKLIPILNLPKKNAKSKRNEKFHV